ncbi:uncharacterized protein LOC127711531 [Mytilus californianus]|uniref:uncharacterized protein LOC127711531 n=1 Tax=Mytilus californianus TaxID=6549 RepID=UPI002246A39F|nr:uncharacterized protein LOC127711531 [Mytilus californianus]
MTKTKIMLRANIEKDNYDRINKLLQGAATPAVKQKFDKEFDPSILKSTLNKSFIGLAKLKKQRVINQQQWTLLFPKNGAPSSSDFDLTLMICLLRNFTDIDKSDVFPIETDTSDAASLLRLKHYRNNIVHSKTFTLSDEDFKQYWEHITCGDAGGPLTCEINGNRVLVGVSA